MPVTVDILSQAEMRIALALRCQQIGGVRTWARALNLSHKHLQDMIHGRRPVSRFIASQLGYRHVTGFVYDPTIVPMPRSE